MRENVKFDAGVIGALVSLLLPVLIIVWYTMEHRLPRIGPFEEGSSGSSLLCGFIFVLIYVAILSIPIIIIKRRIGERLF